ncbi:2OG-Fe(II) oxygenase [Altererythrobacter sp. Z27]|uniref:2OG-Fe(II) oxygenase n=1 Tax=Altererythrobacter sp. Z27 TaxID=3461147 RepID=UPI00404401C2
MQTLIDFQRLDRELADLVKQYRNASPFEYVVIDSFLRPHGIEAIRTEGFFSRATTTEKSSDFIFAKNKIENPKIEELSQVTRQLRDELLSPQFADFLSQLMGFEVFIDPSFAGGGLHQGGAGSFLDMHADFTRHPVRNDWIRELNILLYLNPDYQPDWGGQLELEHSETGQKNSVDPVENRLVIMLTKPHTLHGYKPIRFPARRYRTSIAAYAYSLDDGSRHVPYASTSWRPSNPLKRAFAQAWNPIVVAKQKLFGSRTAKRAQRGAIDKDLG